MEGLHKYGESGKYEEYIAKIADLKKWFKGYKIDTIEINIEGVVKNGDITKLFVSFEGRGGCKVTLKPME